MPWPGSRTTLLLAEWLLAGYTDFLLRTATPPKP